MRWVIAGLCSLSFTYFLSVVIPDLNKFWKRRTIPPPVPCGKLADKVYVFPRPYVFLSPEYEGKSIWEQGYAENKRGCDANFWVISLKLEWPSLSPARDLWAGASRPAGHMGVTVEQIARDQVHGNGLSFQHLIDGTVVESVRDGTYDQASDLHALPKIQLPLRNEVLDIYWHETGAITDTLISCTYYPDGRPFDCSQAWFVENGRVLIRVNYTHDYLPEWNKVRQMISKKIASFKKE